MPSSATCEPTQLDGHPMSTPDAARQVSVQQNRSATPGASLFGVQKGSMQPSSAVCGDVASSSKRRRTLSHWRVKQKAAQADTARVSGALDTSSIVDIDSDQSDLPNATNRNADRSQENW